tara:strand:+ start:100 stop:378 length:279 start_codon:yes stop_codon:yes gene_type:complete
MPYDRKPTPLAFTPSAGVGERRNRFFIQTSEGLIESYLWNGIELPVKVHEWHDERFPPAPQKTGRGHYIYATPGGGEHVPIKTSKIGYRYNE